MEFGKIETSEIDQIDFTLPPDSEETTRLLEENKRPEKTTEVFVGCAKWGRKDWVGKIYPPKTKEADFLDLYSKHFNCIELNATFYKTPSQRQTSGWASKVGDNFRFCPKFTSAITHIRRLKEVAEATERFLKGVAGFGGKLGPLFLMPHPGMGPQTLERIETFIQSLPSTVKVYTELRHPDWFADAETFRRVFSMFEKNKCAAAITDAAGRRDCVHMRLTTPQAFIRFVGNDLHPTDYRRIDDWVQRIKSWMQQGIHQVYFFMHQNEEINSPELCKYFIQQLNLHCGTAIPEPQFVDGTDVDNLPKTKTKKRSD
jgi:uncharacterized protein YecE (DUF72 family)